MTNRYRLQPGTIPHAVVEHLLTLPDYTELATAALNEAIGHSNTGGLSSVLSTARRAGVLSSRIMNGLTFWSLGPNGRAVGIKRERTESELDEDLCKPAETLRSVSANATPSIFAFAAQRGASAFSVAVATDGRMTIERHGRIVLELTNTERTTLIAAAVNGVTPP